MIILGSMMDYNKDNATVLLQLEQLYTAISFCMRSIEKIETRILQAQIENGHLKIDIQQCKKENKELKEKVEDLMSRVQL